MSQYTQGPSKTFSSSGALALNRRVRLDSNGKLAYCSSTDTDCIGTTEREAFAADEQIPVRLATAEGTHVFTANAAVAITDTLYAAASGKVAPSGTVLVGDPLEACSADGDWIEGVSSPSSVLGNIARSALTEDAAQPYPIGLKEFVVWDAPQTNIPGTPASDDLGLVNNTFLTGSPTIETGDLKAAGATSRKVRYQWTVPPEYVAGQPITLRINAGMKTTVADVSATVDAEVARTAAPSTDICATAAQSINSLTAANKDFTLTPTNIVPGDILDVVITVAVNDAATATAVIGKVNKVEHLVDIKG